MHSTNSTTRKELRWSRRLSTVALLIAAVAVTQPALAKSDRGHHGRGGPGGWIERHAEKLGIDDATLAEINAIVAASREKADAIYEEHRQARDVMHEMLEREEPDTAAVMQQAEIIGEIDIRKHKHRLATMLKIRAKLTPAQRSELNAMKGEMRERRGKHHGWRKHHGDGASASASDDDNENEPAAD